MRRGSKRRRRRGWIGWRKAGEGITSSYRTAKAEARQFSTEVHGNMEHCPDIVDSSVCGC